MLNDKEMPSVDERKVKTPANEECKVKLKGRAILNSMSFRDVEQQYFLKWGGSDLKLCRRPFQVLTDSGSAK